MCRLASSPFVSLIDYCSDELRRKGQPQVFLLLCVRWQSLKETQQVPLQRREIEWKQRGQMMNSTIFLFFMQQFISTKLLYHLIIFSPSTTSSTSPISYIHSHQTSPAIHAQTDIIFLFLASPTLFCPSQFISRSKLSKSILYECFHHKCVNKLKVTIRSIYNDILITSFNKSIILQHTSPSSVHHSSLADLIDQLHKSHWSIPLARSTSTSSRCPIHPSCLNQCNHSPIQLNMPWIYVGENYR